MSRNPFILRFSVIVLVLLSAGPGCGDPDDGEGGGSWSGASGGSIGLSSGGDGLNPSGGAGPGTESGGGVSTNAGGNAASGGAIGTGGTSGTGGGTATGTGGGTATGAGCRVERQGATGSEPDGTIPVCCAPGADEKGLIDEVFMLVNEHRAASGVSALAYDTTLEETIQGHCLHMVAHGFFDHTAPEAAVASPWTRAELCGTSANAENIAAGQRSAAAVMESWKGSSGHNANMLSSSSSRIGIGYYEQNWGQLLGQ